MNILRAVSVLPLLALACCTPAVPTADPTPPPPVNTAPPAPPPALAAPQYDNWLDAPQTAGDWTYRDGNALSFATFAQAGSAARFGIECAKSTQTVRLVRGANANGQVPMRIRTETASRLLTATPSPDGRPILAAELPARDSLLDAIALSRGRFAVETGGLDTLYLPAWSEVTRVIEDCR